MNSEPEKIPSKSCSMSLKIVLPLLFLMALPKLDMCVGARQDIL